MLSKIRSRLPLDVRRHVIAQHLTPHNPVDTISSLLLYFRKYISGTQIPTGMSPSITVYFKNHLCITLAPNRHAIVVRISRLHGFMNLSLALLVERNRFTKTNILRFLFFALDNVPLDLQNNQNQNLLRAAQEYVESLTQNTRGNLRLYIQKTLKHATVDPEWLGTAKKSILLYSS